MVIRTYFDRNNTIVRNDDINTGRNPITELFYGGNGGSNTYSRFIFHFDESRLKSMYDCGTFPDLTKLKHTLRMTNTGCFDKELLGDKTCDGKDRACSFDLVLFPITQDWDEGVGYDYNSCGYIGGVASTSVCPSNWSEAQTGAFWSGGSGVYSGNPTILKTQHFEKGNENIEIDVTDIVNGYLTGDTNYGLGLAYKKSFEERITDSLQYVGFFTRHTQTFYEPHIESTFVETIKDDRGNFFLDKKNKLYLYVNVGGQATNLDNIPEVIVYNNDSSPFSAFTSSMVTNVTKGVYCIELLVPSSDNNTDCVEFIDEWRNISINGITRPNIELPFILKSSGSYYDIGLNENTPIKYGFNVVGLNRNESILSGDVRKVYISARIPYTVNQSEALDELYYRIYVKEGQNEFTVIDYQTLNRTINNNYFLLDTDSLLPNTYYLDVKVISNQEVRVVKEIINFRIISQSELRGSQ